MKTMKILFRQENQVRLLMSMVLEITALAIQKIITIEISKWQ
jgi:hypothetical protein